MNTDISHIFRSYDIRGIYGTDLNEEIMEKIGLASSKVINADIVIACDVRIHSESLKAAFLKGFLISGRDAEDIGTLPLGVAGLYAYKNRKHLAYITASHLSKEWNGVKFYDERGIGLFEQSIRDVKKYVESADQA